MLDRVKKGGHNIPPETIERRYKRGIINFFDLYKDQVHNWIIYDNSKEIASPIAKGGKSQETFIYNIDIWESLQKMK